LITFVKDISDVCRWIAEILQQVGVRGLLKVPGRLPVGSIRRHDCVHSDYLQFSDCGLYELFDDKRQPSLQVIGALAQGVGAQFRK